MITVSGGLAITAGLALATALTFAISTSDAHPLDAARYKVGGWSAFAAAMALFLAAVWVEVLT